MQLDRKDSAARSRSLASTPHHDVIILTEDPALLATLREASGSAHRLLHAPTPQVAVDLLGDEQCGMLIIDVALIGEGVVALVDQLQAQFPRVLLLATGHRAEQQAVAGLIGSGRIYRFLHKPISPGRAESFLSSATRRYTELYAQGSRSRPGDALTTSRKRLYALGAGLLAMLGTGVGWWIHGERTSSPIALESELQPAEPATDELPAATVPVPRTETPAAPATGSARNAAPTAPSSSRTPPPPAERTPAARASTPNVDLARAFLAANQLTDPPDASALHSLRNARAANEDESAIQIVATDLGSRLLNQALVALESNDLANAKLAYADAARVDRELEAALPDLDLIATRIEAAEAAAHRATVAALLTRAMQLRESGQLIEPAGGNAIEALQAALDADQTSPEVQAERRQLSFTLLEHARTTLAAGDIDRADILVMRAEQVVAGLPQTRALREQIGAARTQREANTVLQAASLPRTREVPVVYPRDALLNAIEGWVDLEFTISPEGVPTDIRVKDASRARTFDTAAIQALRQWRFEPIVRDGEPRARRAVLRMDFRLESR